MVINVKFSKIWTVEEVQEYILNPNDEKYVNMPNDIYLELVACAEYYATMSYYESTKDDWIDDYTMNEYASQSIASGISDNFYDQMYDSYYEYYAVQTAAHLDEKRKNHYAKELGLIVPENAFIPLSPIIENANLY